MTVAEAIRQAGALLAGAGIEDPSREARALVRLTCGHDALDPSAELDAQRFSALLQRRARREPVSYTHLTLPTNREV